ncbi:hypothetical protein BH20BAC1_BH20BAC1_25180 [soil metagenome]
MKTVPAFIFLFLSFCANCYSQKVIVHAFMENKKATSNSDTIYYDFGKQLAWDDFQGKPDMNHFGGAVTASGFAFDSEMNFDGKTVIINISVHTYFSKKSSWKKPGINSAYHLLHEQHHFDITRLGAEQLIEELSKAKFNEENYRSMLNSIFEKTYRGNNQLQLQYDGETSHSLNAEKQKEWNDRIATAIKKLGNQLAAAK